MQKFVTRMVRGVALVGLVAAIAGATVVVGLRKDSGLAAVHVSAHHETDRHPAPNPDDSRLQRSGLNELIVPPVVVKKMKLKTIAATRPTQAITLPSYQGVLALDNDRLSRVHPRFGGEVVEIGKSTDGSDPTLHVGERVQAGDLLAVVWSTELGRKKSELVDALTKLRSEEQLRDRLKKLYEEGAGAGRSYRDAERDVQCRLVEIASLERTLRTWRLTDSELAAIHAEADRLAQVDDLNETSMPAAEVREWARVEVRAPISGVILEKNAVVGDIVGTDTDLFKIGDLSVLVVWAHVYEDDLPLLESLPQPIQWKVTMPSRPGTEFHGLMEKIGSVIDPAQHTALVAGRVENLSNSLKIGQFVNVTVQLPAPACELELPANAVVEDGQQSVVFVQPAAEVSRFVRRPVQVTRRLREGIYIRATDPGVRAGDVVVTSGALLLQNALEQLPAPAVQTAAPVGHSAAEVPNAG